MVKTVNNQFNDGSPNLSPRLLYYVGPISYKTAMDVVIKNHYLHRKASCSFAFGLFDRHTNKLLGVICYGTPSSSSLRQGICGFEEKNNVIELTRLWIDDSTVRCAESFLIGNTIPLVDKEIIVSYAEIQQGHRGTVYQATNWIYTGLSAKRTNWIIKGIDKHSQTLADKYSAKEIRELYGNGFSLQPRPRKHRYVFFNCNKRRKKELLNKLKYPVLPYPKG
jgi:hypothetical protein